MFARALLSLGRSRVFQSQLGCAAERFRLGASSWPISRARDSDLFAPFRDCGAACSLDVFVAGLVTNATPMEGQPRQCGMQTDSLTTRPPVHRLSGLHCGNADNRLNLKNDTWPGASSLLASRNLLDQSARPLCPGNYSQSSFETIAICTQDWGRIQPKQNRILA